jgi:alkylhydroperoxidase family enzyme
MTFPDPSALGPLSDADWPDDLADLRDGFAGRLNVYRVMAHHPGLLRAWADLRGHVVEQTALGPQLSEVAILRTGLRLGSDYEWSQHVVRARARGLDDARIRAVRGAPEDMDQDDGLVASAVDALLDHHALPPGLRADLTKAIGVEAVLDLCATVGFYSVLAYLLNTYDVPLDDDVAESLRRFPL